ncbi:MAG: hypothetical protein QOG72_446 [Sphingomonadales bacterium]|jgi:hypothetical protein|nr:hypothetical protein [Sphingomonadales bacterium]
MPPFKDSFQDRVGRAAEAKRKALDNLRSKPPVDEAVAAARQEASRQRQVRAEEKRAAKAEEKRAAEAQKAAEGAPVDAKASEASAQPAGTPQPPTEAERKAARDARYAARKSRK